MDGQPITRPSLLESIRDPRVMAGNENILANPGAEEKNGIPDAWEQGASIDGVKYSWDWKVAVAGKASLRIEKTAQGNFPIAQWSQTVTRTGDLSRLEVSAQVKAEKMAKAILDVIFREWVANGH